MIGGWGGFPPGGSKNREVFQQPVFFWGGGCKVKTPKEAVFLEEIIIFFGEDLEERLGR